MMKSMTGFFGRSIRKTLWNGVLFSGLLALSIPILAHEHAATPPGEDAAFYRSGIILVHPAKTGPSSLIGKLVFAFYARFISPVDNRQCIFHPTCSEYARQAVSRHGVVVGVPLSAARLIRCNPSAYSSGNYPAAKLDEDRWRADDPLD
ncbi:MAG TPA: membrane protein insertion efficiency factor YidD [Spirochaetota bacterium]|nr:membrane protein insertion efficiency factor YidD [Spirochaetota bacterium]